MTMQNGAPSLEQAIDALIEKAVERAISRLLPELGAGGGRAIQPRLLTIEQAASYLGRSKAAVQHMVTDGKVPTVRSDRRIFIDVRDLDAWIEEHKQAGI
jgi:excisionase family DNA binding protein